MGGIPQAGNFTLATEQTKRARDLRANATDAERAVWHRLRMRQPGGFRFRRQCPIGPYIVDFVSFEGKLIVEIDGSQHATTQADYDSDRTLG